MIRIFGNSRCTWCNKAKKLAEDYNLKFEWVDTDSPEKLKELKTLLPEVRNIPQIWWGNRHIGGYEGLVTEIQNSVGGYGEGKLS
jgi:glutaredoxin 1